MSNTPIQGRIKWRPPLDYCPSAFSGYLCHIWHYDTLAFMQGRTHQCPLVDSTYFTVVTLCTTGYGDLVPWSLLPKILTIILLLAGLLVVDIFLNGFAVVQFVFDRIEFIFAKKGNMAIRTKMWVSLGIIAFFVVIGTIAIFYFECLDIQLNIYLSVVSGTTVGYGDFS